MRFQEDLIPLYARVIIDACYFSDKGKLPISYADKIESSASFIQGTTGYAEIRIIRNWLRGDIDRSDGKGLSLKNYIPLMQAWVNKKCPMFLTKEDIRHFSSYGRKSFDSWANSDKFDEFCVKNNIKDGSLSPYWKNISLTRPVIWDALALPPELLNDLEALSEEMQKKLTDILDVIAHREIKSFAAKVYWYLDFDLLAIQIATTLANDGLISWEELYESLREIPGRANPSETHKGIVLLLDFVLQQLDAVHREFFIAIGALPFLRHYEPTSFQALWGMRDPSSVEKNLQLLTKWRLINTIGKERWIIQEEVWRFLKIQVEGLPKNRKRFLRNWDKRALKIPKVKIEHSKKLSSHHANLKEIVDIFKIRKKRVEKGLRYTGRRSLLVRLFKQSVSLLPMVGAYDSDDDYLTENSRYINSDQLLYSRFLLFCSDRAWWVFIDSILLSYVLVAFMPFLAWWSRLFFLIMAGWTLLRFLEIEKAWQAWLEEMLPLIPNDEN